MQTFTRFIRGNLFKILAKMNEPINKKEIDKYVFIKLKI